MLSIVINNKVYTNPPIGTLYSPYNEIFYLPDKFIKLVNNNFKICKITLSLNNEPTVINYYGITYYKDELVSLMNSPYYYPIESVNDLNHYAFFYMVELDKKDFSKYKMIYS